MTVWCHLPTIFRTRYALRFAGLLALCVALITTLLLSVVTHAAPGVNQTISFSGRLLASSGAVVPDGYYNIQFKIYQDGTGTTAGNPSGSLKWTETYINDGGTSGVQVKDGFFSVILGSQNPFGTSVDWNQDTLWLSMNIAGAATSCTSFNSGACVADGEMLPMKRITSTPYALNAGNSNKLNNLTASNFVQLSQGVQNDTVDNSASIFVNKTGTGGEFAKFQGNGTDVLTVTNAGNLQFGNNADHSIIVAGANQDTNGNSILMQSGNGGSGTGTDGGNFSIFGGTGGGTNGNGGSVFIQGGAGTGSGSDGSILIGNFNKSYIEIGNANLSSGTQNINIGTNNTSGGTTNITIGSGGSASGGTTAIQSKDNTTISTNGVQRATFDTSGKLYVGNGASSVSPASFTIQGTNSSATAVTGGSLTIQGGNATTGNANGGNLTLSGGSGAGTGTQGLVVLTTPTMQQVSDACVNAVADCTIAASSLNGNATIMVGFSNTVSGKTATLPDPANTTAGRLVYITAAPGSSDFILSVNGGGAGNLTSMRQNTTATLVWNGSDWTVAGASNSTTLQSAYDNTLQSAGGAELVLSNGSNANGLTIRDSSTNPVNGTLLEVQNSSAANLFSVNYNIPEYATDPGAEIAGASSSTFPASTWSSYAGATVSRYTTAGNNIASGQASVQIAQTTASQGASNTLVSKLAPNMTYNVSLTARLGSGSFTDFGIWYSVDGTTISTACVTDKSIVTSVWTKVSCSFQAPASGITTSNALVIGGVSSANRTYYVDNLSVTIAADYNFATDGKVNDSVNFATNWSTAGAGTVNVTRNTSDGYEASDSAQAAITAGAANAGVRNKLSISPLTTTLYRVSTYAKLQSGTFTDFKVRYSPNGGTNFTDCVDYNTQTVTTSGWSLVTCYVTTDGTAATNPYVYFVETASATRTFMVDAFSMTLAQNTAPNVQIGGGNTGGPTTLLTVDRGASAPIASDNDALLGSMYYDTTLGKLQCYEADGWGACGSASDNIITISPEYTNAVMHGTGVGTMTSDLCSDTLDINDATNGPQVCGTYETRNYYTWTSPQASAQSYSIYVTYQLPSTWKAFTSGSTSLQAKTDSSNASVTYQIYRSGSGGLASCGGTTSVATGNVGWQTGVASGSADPSTCGFLAGESIVFKITTTSSSNAHAYVGNLGFTFSNK